MAFVNLFYLRFANDCVLRVGFCTSLWFRVSIGPVMVVARGCERVRACVSSSQSVILHMYQSLCVLDCFLTAPFESCAYLLVRSNCVSARRRCPTGAWALAELIMMDED